MHTVSGADQHGVGDRALFRRLESEVVGSAVLPSPEEVSCPTPIPLTDRALTILVELRNYAVKLFDISRVFLHLPNREEVWVAPPAEWPNLNDEVWAMSCAICGGNRLNVAKVSTEYNISDLFTKSLGREETVRHIYSMGVKDFSGEVVSNATQCHRNNRESGVLELTWA